jgi:hypothetical protein
MEIQQETLWLLAGEPVAGSIATVAGSVCEPVVWFCLARVVAVPADARTGKGMLRISAGYSEFELPITIPAP